MKFCPACCLLTVLLLAGHGEADTCDPAGALNRLEAEVTGPLTDARRARASAILQSLCAPELDAARAGGHKPGEAEDGLRAVQTVPAGAASNQVATTQTATTEIATTEIATTKIATGVSPAPGDATSGTEAAPAATGTTTDSGNSLFGIEFHKAPPDAKGRKRLKRNH